MKYEYEYSLKMTKNYQYFTPDKLPNARKVMAIKVQHTKKLVKNKEHQ